MDTSIRSERSLLVIFADLTRYSAQALCVSDLELAEKMSAHYEQVTTKIEGAGGRVVKFIGDATLAVFPEELADRGVTTMMDLKNEVDAEFTRMGWPCRLVVKMHFGSVVAGDYGGRFDVLGKNVNAAAMLDSLGVALSADAFRKLGPETRKRFKKHTPPITYIRVEDPHRFRPGR
jgi:class 3 adenylate cyclase